MTSDLSEVYDFVVLPDGRRLVKPEICPTCNYVKEKYVFYEKCNICGHLYRVISNTQDKEDACWCKGLVKNRMIDKREDYPEFWKKCLMDSLHQLECIGVTCDICKRKKECEDGGTNTIGIIQTIGYCREIIL